MSQFNPIKLELGELNFDMDSLEALLPTTTPFDPTSDYNVVVTKDVTKSTMNKIFKLGTNYNFNDQVSGTIVHSDPNRVRLYLGSDISANLSPLQSFFGAPEVLPVTLSDISGNTGVVISTEYIQYLASIILGGKDRTGAFRNKDLVTGAIDESIHSHMNTSGATSDNVLTNTSNIMSSIGYGNVANNILNALNTVIAAIDTANSFAASGTELSAYQCQLAAYNAIVPSGYSSTDVPMVIESSTELKVGSKTMTEINASYDTFRSLTYLKIVVGTPAVDNIGVVTGASPNGIDITEGGLYDTAYKVKAQITKLFLTEAMVSSIKYQQVQKAFDDLTVYRNLVNVEINKYVDVKPAADKAVVILNAAIASNIKLAQWVQADISAIVFSNQYYSTISTLSTRIAQFFKEAIFQNTKAIYTVLNADSWSTFESTSNTYTMRNKVTTLNMLSGTNVNTHTSEGLYELVYEDAVYSPMDSVNSTYSKIPNYFKVNRVALTVSSSTSTPAPTVSSVAGVAPVYSTISYAVTVTTAAVPVYYKNVPWFLYNKMYAVAPERFQNILTFDNADGLVSESIWKTYSLPVQVGDTIAYTIQIYPNPLQKHSSVSPKLRKYRVQLTVKADAN